MKGGTGEEGGRLEERDGEHEKEERKGRPPAVSRRKWQTNTKALIHSRTKADEEILMGAQPTYGVPPSRTSIIPPSSSVIPPSSLTDSDERDEGDGRIQTDVHGDGRGEGFSGLFSSQHVSGAGGGGSRLQHQSGFKGQD